METNLTQQFTRTLFEIQKRKLPSHIQHQAKRCLLDYLGATLAGAQMIHDKASALLASLGTEGSIPIVGFQNTSSLINAALLNGLSSHSAELDDGVISAIVHPGAPIISALLPVAEKEEVTGESLLRGIVIGYEAAVRLGDAIQPGHKLRGYHATATCGAVGVAAGVAAMLDLPEPDLREAISTALVSASGTLKVLEGSSELKPYNAGQAAVTGLMAVSLARSGFKAPDDSLSGDFGFLRMTAGAVDEAQFAAGEDTLAVERVYVKPHAACRYCHSPIDAAIKLRSDHSLRAEDVDSISVDTYDLAVKNHDHVEIPSSSSAKMSIPYSVAVALTVGEAGMAQFDMDLVATVNDSGLAKKVRVHSDKELSAIYPHKNPASVTVTTKSGRTYVERVDYPKGEPANPVSDAELEQKFCSLAEYRGWTRPQIDNAIRAMWRIDSYQDLSELWTCIYPPDKDKQ